MYALEEMKRFFFFGCLCLCCCVQSKNWSLGSLI